MANKIFIKNGIRLTQVDFDDILFIESFDMYCHIHLLNGQLIKKIISIKKLNVFLPKQFIQVQRSFVVNINHISFIENNHIYLTKQQSSGKINSISIGLTYKKDLFNKFKVIIE